jgi:arginine decarboxylase
MFGPLPRRFFLTAGAGEASTELNAFDAALLEAGIGDTNLIRMSSILPPGATEVDGYAFERGSFVALAYGALTCAEPGTIISAAIAVGIPSDTEAAGLIMEHAHRGDSMSCEALARDMVHEGLALKRNLNIANIRSLSVSHRVERAGAVFAAVVLCP